MSKLVSAGCLVGLLGIFGSMQGFCLFFGILLLMSFFGTMVAGNIVILTVYIVIVILVNYVGMIVAWIEGKNVFQKIFYAIATPIVAFIVLAVPSSFVVDYGCEAGHNRAELAMQATPVVLIVDWIAGEELFTCSTF